MKVYQVEIRGKGIIPHLFTTKEEAESFGIASFSQYRIWVKDTKRKATA